MVLALAALVALVVALLTGSAAAAVGVVVLALAGIVLLIRDWRTDNVAVTESPVTAAEPPTADELSPDVARPDQL